MHIVKKCRKTKFTPIPVEINFFSSDNENNIYRGNFIHVLVFS